MAIGVKVMRRPEQQVSYVRAALKGMSLTFQHMFQKKHTVQYPEQKSTAPDHSMGAWSISPRWLQVRGVRPLPADLSGQLHQAGAWRG